MDKENTFSYTYSAKENQEVLHIRQKYLPREETKLDELKRLDRLVQNSGIVEGLSLGIIGSMIFGVGFCLATRVFGNAIWLGVILGLIGGAVMLLAYPTCRMRATRVKAQYVPRILELTEEISGQF